MSHAMTGTIDVLNVGQGHLELKLDPANPVELERARRMVSDMLVRGYAIFVEVDGRLAPVREFDEARGVYLITDVPAGPISGDPHVVEDEHKEAEKFAGHELDPPACGRCGRKKHRGRCQTKEVPMHKAKATAIGRTAGG